MPKSKSPPTATPTPTTTPSTPAFKRKRGDNSNTLINQLLSNPGLLANPNLADELKHIHRITPVSKKTKKKHADGDSPTVFNDQSGHHEWIPTSMASEVATVNDKLWWTLWTALRSPTWLLILRPETYCSESDYGQHIKAVIGKIEAAKVVAAATAASASSGKPVKAVPAPPSVPPSKPVYLKASQLGLVGHAGGLNLAGSELTTFQSTWHDELRDIFRRHAAAKAYDLYWAELLSYIKDHFLFVDDLSLNGVVGTRVTYEEIMDHIAWDLQISGRSNPPGLPAQPTMLDAAMYLRSQWDYWGQALYNTFRAYRNFPG